MNKEEPYAVYVFSSKAELWSFDSFPVPVRQSSHCLLKTAVNFYVITKLQLHVLDMRIKFESPVDPFMTAKKIETQPYKSNIQYKQLDFLLCLVLIELQRYKVVTQLNLNANSKFILDMLF